MSEDEMLKLADKAVVNVENQCRPGPEQQMRAFEERRVSAMEADIHQLASALRQAVARVRELERSVESKDYILGECKSTIIGLGAHATNTGVFLISQHVRTLVEMIESSTEITRRRAGSDGEVGT